MVRVDTKARKSLFIHEFGEAIGEIDYHNLKIFVVKKLS